MAVANEPLKRYSPVFPLMVLAGAVPVTAVPVPSKATVPVGSIAALIPAF
jgi:hypothetical protein